MTREEAVEILRKMRDDTLRAYCPLSVKPNENRREWEYNALKQWNNEIQAIGKAIDALNQQEITRCKDCVNLMRPHICRLYMSNCDLEFYCANARRREE